MRIGLTRRTGAFVLTALCLHGCTVRVSGEKPDPEPTTRREGNGGYSLPDTPFTRDGVVVTATCLMGARFAAVSVQAWDAERWVPLGERMFAIPTDAAFTNYPGVKAVNTALVDLCRQRADEPSVYRVDALEHIAPRVRALFDLAFTRMAVVLRDPGSDATYAGFVTGDQDDLLPLNDATSDDEQNAVMSPDGRSVWFTYTTPSGEPRIGSRSVDGDHRLSDEGPAAGHDLPLTVWGKPPLAVQADMVRFSQGGRRVTAATPRVFGHVFDAPGSSGALTGNSVRNATHVSDCVSVVGWIGDTRVLCHTGSGAFRVMDARSGRAVEAPVEVVDEYDGDAAEGALVSPDGTTFVVSVHPPNDRYGLPAPDFRVVSTVRGDSVPIPGDGLSANTTFLEWR